MLLYMFDLQSQTVMVHPNSFHFHKPNSGHHVYSYRLGLEDDGSAHCLFAQAG